MSTKGKIFKVQVFRLLENSFSTLFDSRRIGYIQFVGSNFSRNFKSFTGSFFRLSFIVQCEFLLPFTGCRKVLAKMPVFWWHYFVCVRGRDVFAPVRALLMRTKLVSTATLFYSHRLLINLSDEPLAKIDELCTGPLSELVTKNLKGDEGSSEYPTLSKYGDKLMRLVHVSFSSFQGMLRTKLTCFSRVFPYGTT